MSRTAGLYIHIPFCSVKCDYCSFYSITNADDSLMKSYLDKCVKQYEYLRQLYEIDKIDTVFIGGGTPSLIPPSMFAAFTDSLKLNSSNIAEFSVEVNPESATKDFLTAALDSGVTRISCGVQSFSGNSRTAIGRNTSSVPDESLKRIAKAGFRHFSADLISDIPGDSPQRIEADIKKVSELGADHISIYSLSVEEGTALYDRCIDEFDSSREYDEVMQHALANCGYSRYEISNYCRPGCESKHNLKYWNMDDFIGVGAAASGTVGIFDQSGSYGSGKNFYFERKDNPASIDKFLKLPVKDFAQTSRLERLDSIFESLMMGLRLVDGLDKQRFAIRFGKQPCDFFPETLKEYTDFFIDNEKKLRLTSGGLDIQNRILVEILEELENSCS